ncbi:MAG: sulfatase-like hydrolase/transferase [Saprospiraceae bacterium]|nr:sulfatase-like hydrolase/transferase [Saprospiraceae bacterium]
MHRLLPLFLLLLIGELIYAQNSRPNILWITCEDISPAWGCYGDSLATTPNLDAIASKGFYFTSAFSNAPICAPARSTLITGLYATSLGTQHLRSEIPVPADMKTLPEYLSENGYFTSNNAKTDYNFSPDGRWSESGGDAHWRSRNTNQPFFSVFNFGITHEGHANSAKPEDTEPLAVKHDPKEMIIPPYYPDTEEFRKIIAHQYDLITVFDQEVGKLLDQLEADGLYDETIIFIFSDHGYGLPRYKRWLYNSGMQVPFILYVPDKYRELASNLKGSAIGSMVSFVDFAPTVLTLAGVEIPKLMEGNNFLGEAARMSTYTYGFRDRADDAYDMSRSVFNGRFLFVRNFMPHKPYIQNALIFNENKRSYLELHKLRMAGSLGPEPLKMFNEKPVEELYDLKNDPAELNNLIDDKRYVNVAKILRGVLFKHMLDTKDTGLMNEGNMMVRSSHGSVLELTRSSDQVPFDRLLTTADLIGKIKDPAALIPIFDDPDPDVRYWALMAFDAYEGDVPVEKSWLINSLNDAFIANRALAAEILLKRFDDSDALDILQECLLTDNEPVLLQVSISVRNIGMKAQPLIPFIREEIYPKISGDIWGKYKSWSYPMFIGMALDQTMKNCL